LKAFLATFKKDLEVDGPERERQTEESGGFSSKGTSYGKEE